MRILIVEDYPPVADRIAQGLREENFAVDLAADGEMGLYYATTGEYDVIVLDLMLPKIDGLTILKRLRKLGKTACVLILTAKDRVEDRIEGLNSGADDYLVKPFAFAELSARIHALVRRKYAKQNPVIKVGDLVVDTAAHRVSRGTERIDLTAKEYALVEFLALRQNQLVTRSDIWEHVYDFHSEAASNVVDVYIGYLRKKIERAGKPTLIHTRRGQGYMLGDAFGEPGDR